VGSVKGNKTGGTGGSSKSSTSLGSSESSSSSEVADLEQQIRKLVSERNELVKHLSAAKLETSKLDGRVQMLTKDRSELQASVATLERENRDLVRGRDILQTKVSNTPDNKRLQNELSQANQQLEASQKVREKERNYWNEHNVLLLIQRNCTRLRYNLIQPTNNGRTKSHRSKRNNQIKSTKSIN
jgi:chromosome segregation ATPase